MAALGTVGAVKSLVYDAIFKRAQEIAASEKLRSVVFGGDGLLKATAECVGSSPSDIYVLNVSIDGATAMGDCSCPAGKSAKSGLCKHAVALLVRRAQTIQETKPGPSGNPPDEVVISIASENDDITTAQDVRKSADRREAIQSTTQSTVARGIGPPASSSSKRALPAWMLGVVGSAAADQTQSSRKGKPNKRVAEPKLPLPPPPTKRARRPSRTMKISNDSDKEGEDPGEVYDEPMEECPAPEVPEDDKVPGTMDPPSEGAAARERRRLRASKKEAVVLANDDGNEEVKRTRGRSSSRAGSREVLDQPVRAAKRRRLAKKYVEEDDNDGSDSAPLQEQLEREKKATKQPEELALTAHLEPIDEGQQPDFCQGKKSSSIFSMNRWKEMTSEGRSTGGVLSLATDDLDLETLKSYTFAASSQSTSQSDNPSLNAKDASAEPAIASQDTHMATPTATGYFSSDAVTNNMLNIFFGSSLSQGSPQKVPAATSTPNASQDGPNHSAAAAGVRFETSTPASVPPEGVAVPVARTDLVDCGGEIKPKKKSSLKDRVKMLLS